MSVFICSKCNYRREQEETISGECPDCGASSWLCHLHSEAGLKLAAVTSSEPMRKPSEPKIGCNKIKCLPNHGHRLGRPRKEVHIKKMMELQARGFGLRDIGRQLGVSHMTVSRALKQGGQ